MSNLGKTGKIFTRETFCDKSKNYILNNFRHAEDIVCISTDLEYPTMDFQARHIPEDLTEDEENICSKQITWEIKLRKYLDGEDIMQEKTGFIRQ